ncbi:hypothetical protein OE88DRAFT_1668846 [Heliocybe sulcata]|uniref:Uncharacterized protein n=1 Tax=Heliocybe sulcata TaxID=5364 RepID=A0A5C3MWC3_9AGAM|nr:hypothetical protein OE88DRAFT_1668846 [Heliocybe sulcata]
MHEKHVGFEEATEMVRNLLRSRLLDASREKEVLLSLAFDETTKAHLQQYIFWSECWIVGSEPWHLRSRRYKADRIKVNDIPMDEQDLP